MVNRNSMKKVCEGSNEDIDLASIFNIVYGSPVRKTTSEKNTRTPKKQLITPSKVCSLALEHNMEKLGLNRTADSDPFNYVCKFHGMKRDVLPVSENYTTRYSGNKRIKTKAEELRGSGVVKSLFQELLNDENSNMNRYMKNKAKEIMSKQIQE